MSFTPAPTRWIKASASAVNGDCLEMRQTETAVEVRDTKHSLGPTLRFTLAAFIAWLEGAKNSEFDHLLI
jgi:hypothetical protein